MKKRMRLVNVAAMAAVLSMLMAVPALAHVSITPGEGSVGSTAILAFKVGHGCDGSPTNEVTIQVPAGIGAVKAENIAGWDLSYERGTLIEPVESGDDTITEGVVSVTWSGGSLPDDQIQRFTLQVGLPAHGEGTTLWFPTVQTCDEGEHAWINIPAEGEDSHSIDDPAPGLSLVAASDGHGGHGGAGDSAATGDEANAEEAAASALGDGVAASGETQSDGSGGTDTLTWIAFILGLLGIGGAGYAIMQVRRT